MDHHVGALKDSTHDVIPRRLLAVATPSATESRQQSQHSRYTRYVLQDIYKYHIKCSVSYVRLTRMPSTVVSESKRVHHEKSLADVPTSRPMFEGE